MCYFLIVILRYCIHNTRKFTLLESWKNLLLCKRDYMNLFAFCVILYLQNDHILVLLKYESFFFLSKKSHYTQYNILIDIWAFFCVTFTSSDKVYNEGFKMFIFFSRISLKVKISSHFRVFAWQFTFQKVSFLLLQYLYVCLKRRVTRFFFFFCFSIAKREFFLMH